MSVLAASQEVRRRPPWRLLALPALVVPAIAALAWFAPALGLWSILGLGGLIVAGACALLRPLLPSMFGPILWYDLVGTARRGRYVFVRCLYLAALLGMLFVLYTKWFGGASLFDVFTAERIDRNRVSAFNDSFFEMFVTVQFLVLVLLTPGVTAGAVAEEKDRKTLEYLLSTDLYNHEIVLGKLVSRLAYLTLVLLAGLPVLGLLQLLGGVDPGLVLGSFAVTGLTMLSLATLSIFNSVYATRPRTAIVLTYVLAAAYFVLTLCSLWVWDVGSMPWPVKWLCGGNPYVAVQELQHTVVSQNAVGPAFVLGSPPPGAVGGPAAFLPPILLRYAASHLTVTVLCLVGSLAGLRLWARWQASGRTRRAYVIAITQPRLPRVSGRPMLWKELHTEPLFRLGEAAQIIITTFVALGLIFIVFVLLSVVTVGLMMGNLETSMNTTVRVMGTVLAALMVLGTAVRAAGAISGERDRQTMETLLTTPIENDTIVWSKWWGSVLGVRKAGYALLLLWVVGVVTGGLSPFALPLLLLALVAYLAFAASLGLWFSLRSRTTLRATIGTLVALTGVSLGHWLLTFCCSPLALLGSASPPPFMSGPTPSPGWTEWLADVQKYALTPPVTMTTLAFTNHEILGHGLDFGYGGDAGWLGAQPLPRLGLCFVGIILYGLLAMVLLMLTAARFTVVTGRLPLPGTVPRRLAPPRGRQVGRR